MRVHLEEYEADGLHRERTEDLDATSVHRVFESFSGAWSATIRVPGEQQELAVSFSSGHVAVMLASGDDFYDLLADPPASGWVNFAHGGQLAEHPRRHCVPLEAAIQCAARFLLMRHIAVPSEPWEKQGEYQGG